MDGVKVDAEKVRKGMECCVLRDPDDHRRCGECPYNPHAISNEPCENGLKFNALSLIRQQDEKIHELQTKVHELQTARQWSSVKDRMPGSVPDEYLVVNDGKVQLAIFMDGMWITPHRVSSITYWMPLPEPPQEESQV